MNSHAPVGLGLDSSAVRAAMVRKLAGTGIAHPAVLQAIGEVERHRFVDSALVNQAYEDTSLPIGLGQTISKLLGLSESECAVKKGALWWLRYRERDGIGQTVVVTVQSPEVL